jgi:hypothetical protein
LWLSGNQTDIPQLGEIEYINELTKHHGYDNIKNNAECVASLLSSESSETKETLRPDEPKNDNTYSEGMFNLKCTEYTLFLRHNNHHFSKVLNFSCIHILESSIPSIENAVANLIFSPTNHERLATSAEEGMYLSLRDHRNSN